MNRRNLLAASGALALAALAGCTADDGSSTETETPTPTLVTPPDVDEERLAELATGNAAFALDLQEHLAQQGGNQFFSPYSISVALAMTYAGARGETETQMRETLQYTLGEEVHPAFADLRAVLRSRSTTEEYEGDGAVPAFELSTANALWGQEGYPFAEDYLDLVEDHYGAGLREADFAGDPGGERERINGWVAEQTENRIEGLLPDGSLDASTVLVLTNAIYFMASWQFEFDPEDTEDGTFTALDGTESTVPMMHQHLRTNYADLDDAQVVELPYVGQDVSMVLLVPDEGHFEQFERDLDADRLFEFFDELHDATGDLAMPSFEYETSVTLSKALADLGMPVTFGGDADFSGMVEGNEAGLWIDEVFHDAFVSVDEEGTEAAASTAVSVAQSMPPEWGELRLDRPFMFAIRDRPTDAVLFLGRVVDAGEAQG